MPRTFRTTESLEAEKITRRMLVPFLQTRGYDNLRDDRKLHGKTESQTIHGIDPSGKPIALRVKLCWRREREGKSSHSYSAAQLLVYVEPGTWIKKLDSFVERLRAEGITHLLLMQRVGNEFSHAAQIPLREIPAVWAAQRNESSALIDSGKLGRRKKNHAENGQSPTLWLEDESAPTVPEKLWQYDGVIDVVTLPSRESYTQIQPDDSIDDLPGFDPNLLGKDETNRVPRITSGVPRDPAVRREVLRRSGYKCERQGCNVHRPYSGFLDVHHILGVEKSDRVWNCVALCPNCHREAHFSPDRDGLNRQLLDYASRIKAS